MNMTKNEYLKKCMMAGVPAADAVACIDSVAGEVVHVADGCCESSSESSRPKMDNFAVMKYQQDFFSSVAAKVAADRRKLNGESTGLGDMIASALDAVGITKERVQALASKVGIKDCGCNERQRIANELGAKYLGIGQKPS